MEFKGTKEWSDSAFREIFENKLRAINDKKSTNNLIMIWLDRSVNEYSAELLERYKKIESVLSKIVGSVDYYHNTGVDIEVHYTEAKEALNH